MDLCYAEKTVTRWRRKLADVATQALSFCLIVNCIHPMQVTVDLQIVYHLYLLLQNEQSKFCSSCQVMLNLDLFKYSSFITLATGV